jgi:NAD dependent epimerase/dehydratase family enzyme
MLLASQRVEPKRVAATDYSYAHTGLEPALREAITQS